MRLVLLLAFVAGPALAGTHVPTFEPDPAYTKAPIAGLRSLVADPALLVARLSPASEVPASAEHVKNAAPDGLSFTNPASNWADVAINGVAIGNIGPYSTVQVSGVAAGPYVLTLTFASGYVRTFVVE